jgi:hypothetical protein
MIADLELLSATSRWATGIHPTTAHALDRDASRGGRRLPLFGPDGPRRRRRALCPRGPLPSTGRRNEPALAREMQQRPSLRRPILKPRKIGVKGALRASLCDPFGTLDPESWRGVSGAYRRDGQVRGLRRRLVPTDQAKYAYRPA